MKASSPRLSQAPRLHSPPPPSKFRIFKRKESDDEAFSSEEVHESSGGVRESGLHLWLAVRWWADNVEKHVKCGLAKNGHLENYQRYSASISECSAGTGGVFSKTNRRLLVLITVVHHIGRKLFASDLWLWVCESSINTLRSCTDLWIYFNTFFFFCLWLKEQDKVRTQLQELLHHVVQEVTSSRRSLWGQLG